MTRVQIHDLETAPPPSADALKTLDDKFGTTLNIFGAMANSPAVLNAFLALEGAIAEHNPLDRKTRDAIHLTNYFNHFVDTEQDVPQAPPV